MSRDKLFCGWTSCLCSLLRQTSGDMIHIHLSIGRRPICPFIWDTWALGHSLLLPSQKPWLFLFFFSVEWFLQGAGHISQRCGIRTTTKQQGELAEVLQTPMMRCYSLVLVTGCHQKKNIHRSPKGMDEVSDNTNGSSVMSKWCSVGYWKARKWAKKISLTALQPEQLIWGRGRLTFSMQIWDAKSLCFPVLMPAIRLKTASLLQKNCINVPLNSCAR